MYIQSWILPYSVPLSESCHIIDVVLEFLVLGFCVCVLCTLRGPAPERLSDRRVRALSPSTPPAWLVPTQSVWWVLDCGLYSKLQIIYLFSLLLLYHSHCLTQHMTMSPYLFHIYNHFTVQFKTLTVNAASITFYTIMKQFAYIGTGVELQSHFSLFYPLCS